MTVVRQSILKRNLEGKKHFAKSSKSYRGSCDPYRCGHVDRAGQREGRITRGYQEGDVEGHRALGLVPLTL